MDAAQRRREEDIRRLRELARTSEGRIAIEKVSGTPPSSVTLRLGYVTAASRNYPTETTDVIRLKCFIPTSTPRAWCVWAIRGLRAKHSTPWCGA